MKRFLNINSIVIIFVIVGLLFIYKEVITGKKILFPSNFLAQVYSPWRTQKFPTWEHGIPHKPIGDDQIRLFYPERTFANEQISKREIPLWNPYIFAGTPFLADFQSAIFYPFNFLYFFLPQITAWQILLLIQPIMAISFMYLYLKLFKINKYATWLGAISFGFSGFMLTWSQEHVTSGQAGLWLPLILFGIEGYLKNKKFYYWAIAGFSLACSILGGFVQMTFYIFALSFLYGLVRAISLKVSINYIVRIIGIYIFSLSLTAIQIIPSIEAFLESPRSTSSAWYLFEGYLLPITHILNVFIPDIFGNPGAYNFFGRGFYRESVLYPGFIPFIIAVFAGLKLRKNPIVYFFTISAIISFSLTIDSPLTRLLFRLPLPLLPTFLPSRILFLTSFSIAVLSSFGLSALTERNKKNDFKVILNISIIFFIAILLVGFYAVLLLKYGNIGIFQKLNNYIIRHGSTLTQENILALIRNLILPITMLSLFVIAILNRKKIISFMFFIISLTLFGQFYFLNKYAVIGDPQFLYPQNDVLRYIQSKNSLDRFLALREPFEENISTYAKIYSVEGANPVFPRRYGQLLFAIKNNGKIAKDIPRIEARLSELGNTENPFTDTKRLKLYSLLGIKYLFYYDNGGQSKDANEDPKGNFIKVWENDNWTEFLNTKAYPRVFFANKILIENDPQKILEKLFDPLIDLRDTLILEQKPKELSSVEKSSRKDQGSLAIINSYTPNEILINTKNEYSQMLFLSDNYYPGWKAFVDGKEAYIYRANYSFRSILVPKGNHSIRFTFDPLSFRLGLSISMVSPLLIVIIFRLGK